MQHKIVKLGTSARDELIKGAELLSDAVKITLGPFGQNFFLEKGNVITNDGIRIAREIESKDEFQNRGIDVLRQAAAKTNDEVGDGTTTSIVLACAIIKEAVKLLPKNGTALGKKTIAEIREQLKSESEEVIKMLVDMAKPIETKDQLIKSALVSVEDEELAELIGGMQFDLGKDAVILAEETPNIKSSIERINGIRIDNGFGTSYLQNNLEKQTMEVKECKVILTNFILQSLLPLKPLYDALAKQGVRDFAIIARGFGEEAIKHVMENHKAGFRIWPINAPFQDQAEIMKDMAAVLGGTFISTESHSLEEIQVSDVGHAVNIVSGRWSAIFTGEDNEIAKKRIKARIIELKEKFKGEPSDFEKKNLQSRMGQLENGFGIVKVGAKSEIDRRYKKDKCDDAVNAVKAAFEEGVVPGAGIAFKTISAKLPDTYILKRPLLAVYEQIMATAPAGFIVPKWVKDPVKVLRVALEKASSVASVFATAGGASVFERERPKYVSMDESKGIDQEAFKRDNLIKGEQGL